MAKHRRVWNEKKFCQYLKEGRGMGEMESYKPWISVQDFASQGMVSRVLGVKSQRIHHLLSNNELYFFYQLDWSDKVIDIREQYPLLDVADAIEIAGQAGIRYPYDNQSGFPYVLTSDFFIVTITGIKVRSVKMESELENKRTLEKLEIERRYWEKRGIDWKIVTEKQVSRQKAYNIEWLSHARDIQKILSPSETPAVQYFIQCCQETELTYLDIAREVENRYFLHKGMGVTIFRYLAYWKKIKVDITSREMLMEPRQTEVIEMVG